MIDLTTFIKARLDEDERDASEDHTLGCKVGDFDPGGEADLTNPEACDCRVRRRLLEVAAKRELLDAFDLSQSRELMPEGWLLMKPVVFAVAALWADHPDYNPAWAVRAAEVPEPGPARWTPETEDLLGKLRRDHETTFKRYGQGWHWQCPLPCGADGLQRDYGAMRVEALTHERQAILAGLAGAGLLVQPTEAQR